VVPSCHLTGRIARGPSTGSSFHARLIGWTKKQTSGRHRVGPNADWAGFPAGTRADCDV